MKKDKLKNYIPYIVMGVIVLLLISLIIIKACRSGKYDEESLAGNSSIEMDNTTAIDTTETFAVEDDVATATDIQEVSEENDFDYTLYQEIISDVPEDMLAYWQVLNNKKSFVSSNEGNQEFYLNEYYWKRDSLSEFPFETNQFIIVDLDGDGNNEIVLYTMLEQAEVLDYQDGVVYGYQFVYRGLKNILTNGVFNGSSGASDGGWYRITEFDKGSYKQEALAIMKNDYYEVEGEQVSQEVFSEYSNQFIEGEMAEVIEYSEDNIDKYLLPEVSSVNMCVLYDSPIESLHDSVLDFSGSDETMRAFKEVLLNERQFYKAFDYGMKYYLNAFIYDEKSFEPVYFSVVDMDTDGQDEVVLFDMSHTLILYYEDDIVHGYTFDSWDEIGTQISKDGVFSSANSVDEIVYKKIQRFKEYVEIETLNDYEGNINENLVRYYALNEDNIRKYLGGEALEEIKTYFDSVTGEMLENCDMKYSVDTDNEPLVSLGSFEENVGLYGIHINDESAMLLYVDGEKIFVNESYRNLYYEYPKLNYVDIDNDDVQEIIISYRTVTGSIKQYGYIVCDYIEAWKVYKYEKYVDDVNAIIKYEFDDEKDSITFIDSNGGVLANVELPEWTDDYPCTGNVNFSDSIYFDAETMQLEVETLIECKNSLPYVPLKIVFDVVYNEGGFYLGEYEIQYIE